MVVVIIGGKPIRHSWEILFPGVLVLAVIHKVIVVC